MVLALANNSPAVETKTKKAINKLTSVTNLTIDDIRRIAEEQGLTLEKLFGVIERNLSAKKAIMNKFGDVSYEEDNTTQLKASELGLNVLRALEKRVEDVGGQAVVTHKMAPEDITRLEAIAKELKTLESRLNKDKIQQGHIIDVGANK